MAPLGSVAIPRMVPVSSCARAHPLASSKIAASLILPGPNTTIRLAIHAPDIESLHVVWNRQRVCTPLRVRLHLRKHPTGSNFSWRTRSAAGPNEELCCPDLAQAEDVWVPLLLRCH